MKKICVIVATNKEAEIIKGIPGISFIVSGVGSKNAQKAVSHANIKGASHIISFGTAGGLSPSLKKGDVVIPEHILKYKKEKALNVDPMWHKQVVALLKEPPFTLSTEKLLSVERVILDPAQKKRLYLETGCVSLDMESYFIAQACSEKKMHFLCIRAISDTYSMKIPDWIPLCIDSSGRFLPHFFIKELIKHPFHIKELICISDGFFKARKSLRYIINRIDPSFPHRALSR